MAAELGGLILSGGLLLAATTFAGRKRARQEDDESIARNLSQARQSFDKEYTNALTRSIDTICLATRFDQSSSYQLLQRSLSSHLSVSSEFVMTSGFPSTSSSSSSSSSSLASGESLSIPSLDINLSFLLGNVPSFQKERELFQTLAKEGILLCPGEAMGLSTPGHFFITTPVNTEKEVDLITQRLAKVIKSYLATHPSTTSSSSTPSAVTAASAPAAPATETASSTSTAVASTEDAAASTTTPVKKEEPAAAVAGGAATTESGSEVKPEENTKAVPPATPAATEPVYESEAESVASKTRGAVRRTGRTPSAKFKNPRTVNKEA